MTSIQGEELFDLLIELAEVEKDVARKEFSKIMDRLNLTFDTLNTENIRLVMAEYLKDFQKNYGDVLTSLDYPLQA